MNARAGLLADPAEVRAILIASARAGEAIPTADIETEITAAIVTAMIGGSALSLYRRRILDMVEGMKKSLSVAIGRFTNACSKPQSAVSTLSLSCQIPDTRDRTAVRS